MKLSKFIPALLITVIALTGCDSVRSFLGKPTSEDIRKAREEQFKAERALADSARTEVAAAVPEQQTQETAGTIHRYNVVVGSFINPAYAKRLAGKMTESGETVTIINLKNGMTAISVLDTDDFHEACRKLNSTESDNKFSYDCWIYDSATGQHK